MPTDLPENRAEGDPAHEDDHNQLHDLYNFFNNLGVGKVVVGSASPGTGTDMNIDTADRVTQASVEAYADALAGRIIATNTTVASFPTTGLNVDDYALLTQVDGANPAGLYQWTSGSSWTMRLSAPEFTLIDDDTFTADSADHGATQQSIKAYVDSGAGTITGLVDFADGTPSPITPASTDKVLAFDASNSNSLSVISFSDFPTGGTGTNDGTYSAVTHSSAGTLTLDFSAANGFKVTASQNITDIAVTNGPSAGNYKHRWVEIVCATNAITFAAPSVEGVDSDIPTSLNVGDSFMADLVVMA